MEIFGHRWAYNQEDGWNELIQNYNDKVNECKNNIESQEREENKQENPLLSV